MGQNRRDANKDDQLSRAFGDTLMHWFRGSNCCAARRLKHKVRKDGGFLDWTDRGWHRSVTESFTQLDSFGVNAFTLRTCPLTIIASERGTEATGQAIIAPCGALGLPAARKVGEIFGRIGPSCGAFRMIAFARRLAQQWWRG